MEYYSAIKRNELESVLVRWTNPEPSMQSEVHQKEKNKYRILTHKDGVWKNDTDESICRAGIETQTQRRDLWTQQRKQRVGQIQSSSKERTFSSVQSLSRVRLCDPMNHSTPGLPVHHQLLEFTHSCPSSQ